MIALLPAGNPGPFTGPAGNNTWLIDGAEPLLVDAGVGDATHLDALRRTLVGRALARVFLTHGHRDHAAGLPHLRAAWPGLQVVGADAAPATDGSWIPAGSTRVQVIATPGHSSDHACLWDPDARALFAGDLLVSGGTVMIAVSSGGSLREYLASLARVRALDAARVYPGHGPVIEEPRTLIDQYVSHRRERERQVIEALSRGPASLDALTSAIYPDLAGALRGAARETVLAHLLKLEDEARAAEDAGTWSLC